MIATNVTTGRPRGARFASPPATPRAASIDDVIAANRTAWLRDAEAALTVLDWQAFSGGRTFHVLDFAELGAPAEGYLGFTTGAELHELAADFIPRRIFRTPAAAVAVNVDRVARSAPAATRAGECDPIVTIRAAVAAVAAHELAHVLDCQANGRRLAPGTTLDGAIRCLVDGSVMEPGHKTTTHGPGWIRAFAHLTTRAARLPHFEAWLGRFIRDVEAVLPHSAETFIDALHPELARHSADDRLVEILRTPAPAGFLALFETPPATKET